MSEPGFCVITIDDVDGKKSVCIENSDIKIEAKSSALGEAIVLGSEMNADRELFKRVKNGIDEEFNFYAFDEEWRNANKERQIELRKIFDKYDAAILAAKKQFIIDNPSSYYSVFILSDIDWSFNSSSEFYEFISHLSPVLDGYSYLEEIKEVFERVESVEVGKIAPDFEMKDIEGNMVRLYDLVKESEFLLVSFWASNCGPCRRENPNNVMAYKEFHDKGLNIISISTDSNRENWLQAVAEDDIGEWVNVCNFQKWSDHEIVKLYALRQSSENLLLDNTGKIILKNVKGEELQKRIAELFDEKK